MTYYAILDTNVLVSALLKNGSIPWQVMEEAMRGDIIPVINDSILAEYENVLKRPKFKFDKRAVKIFLDEIKKRAVFAEPGLFEDVVLDEKDVIFYAVLMEKRKEEETYLVTGNLKHFPMRTYVVSPREMMEIVREGR